MHGSGFVEECDAAFVVFVPIFEVASNDIKSNQEEGLGCDKRWSNFISSWKRRHVRVRMREKKAKRHMHQLACSIEVQTK